ncbi:MAG: lysozyme inhibitor LprI family protein [Chromatiaceae bacterium]
MGDLYKDLRATLGGAEADALRAAQRAWIKRRDRICPTTAADRDSVPKRARAVECLRHVTDERIAELRALLQSVSHR